MKSQKRTYNSPTRSSQAEATKSRILEAARTLFVDKGYAATTLAGIAQAAGVSAPTVVAVFGTKAAIVDALTKQLIRGDSAPEPLVTRRWWQDMLLEADPSAQLDKFAAIARRIHNATTDIFEIVRGAATADPEIAAQKRALGLSRYEDNKGVAESLEQKGGLAEGISVDEATDILWALASADMYRLLVVERGWQPEKYESWLSQTLKASLLRHD